MPTTLEETQIPPVASAPVQPSVPLSTSVNPGSVYSAQNIQQTYTTSPKKLKDMKIGSLEKKIAKANSIAEMNQVEIMNAPKAMGVLTGESAHQSRLDTAKLNALTGIYNTKLADLQRKEEERQRFIAQYGADPKQRPDGMSKREFAKAIQGGKFSELLTEDFKQKQLQTLAAQKSLSGGGGSGTIAGTNPELSALAKIYEQTGGDWGATANTLASQGFDVSSGSVIDNELRRRNGLPPIQQLTPAQKMKEEEFQKQEMAAAESAIPELEKKLTLLESVTGRGVGAGLTGFIERNIPSLFGAKPDNLTRIQAIIGKETLDALLNLKARGGTLGAISEKELSLLQASANRIGASEISDGKGNVSGYRMTEGEFYKEINAMKEATKRVLSAAKSKINTNDPLGLGL